jgi:micrococcal nuclease
MNTYIFEAYCTNVVDGDTADLVIDVGFRMTTEQRVRLLGINTPERNHPGYQEAKDYLVERILNKDLLVETRKSDVFGRYLATIYVDGESVNQELLTLELAVPYTK